MQFLIVAFACYGLSVLLTILIKPKIDTYWVVMIASAAVLLYCKFVSGFSISQTWEYFIVLLFACTGFAYWLPYKKKVP